MTPTLSPQVLRAQNFDITWNGYHPAMVDEVLHQLADELEVTVAASQDPAVGLDVIRNSRFRRRSRGYQPAAVDAVLESVRRRLHELDIAHRPHADLAGRIDAWQCALTYNGYEEAAVAAAMDELANRLFTLAGPVPAPVADLIQNMRFPIAPRGRDRKQVDRFMTELADELRKRAAL